MANFEDDDVLGEERIKEIEDCIKFFGKEGAANMCKISVETINKLFCGMDANPIDRTELAKTSKTNKLSKRKSSSDPVSNEKRSRITDKTNDDESNLDIIISDSEEEEKENNNSDDRSQNRMISTNNNNNNNTRNSNLDQPTRSDSNRNLGNNFILNSFKTLLDAKKTLIDTDNLVSVIICNLMSTSQDIFLHPIASKTTNLFLTERSLSSNCLSVTVYLAVTSFGTKFKPAFQLNTPTIRRPLIKNDDVEHVQNRNEWLSTVFKQEIEKNMIYNCVCISDNDILYYDKESKEKINQLNHELIIIPASLCPAISPFQRSILLTLNGVLHRKFLKSNKFSNTLDNSIRHLSEAWQKLTEDDIKNSFQCITK